MKKREFVMRRKHDVTRKLTLISISVLLISVMFVNFVPIESEAADGEFAGGTGTIHDPYMIEDVHDLQAMEDDLSAHYALANDIDASGTRDWNDGAGFEPIGNSDNQFNGSLDGHNHTITGLYIDRPMCDLVGLFGVVDTGGIVSNFGMVDISVNGHYHVGGVVGHNRGRVSGVYIIGDYVRGEFGLGGLIGSNRGYVINSSSSMNIIDAFSIGGLVGNNFEGGSIFNSYATGNLSGRGLGGHWGYNQIGGLIGYNRGIVEFSFATGNINGLDSYVGGLVGYNWDGTVSNSYATGSVSGDMHVGGLVGWNLGMVSNSYARGTVRGTSEYVGGLVGWNWRTVSNSFYDTETSGQYDTDKGEPKTTTEMINMRTYQDAGWDIVSVFDTDSRNANHTWNIVDGKTYPFLSWEVDVSETDEAGVLLPIWLILMIVVLIVALVLTFILLGKRGKKVTSYESEDIWSTNDDL